MTQASGLYFKMHQRSVDAVEFRRRALDFYKDEITDRLFYEKLAKKISDDQFRSQLIELSRIEDEHASFWEQELKNISEDPSKMKGNWLKIRFLFFVMRLIGPVLTIRMLEHFCDVCMGSTSTTTAPALSALYVVYWMILFHDASPMLFARWWFFTIPAMFRPSKAMRS